MRTTLPRLVLRLALVAILIAVNLWLAFWLRDFAAEMAVQGRMELLGLTVAGLLLLYAVVLAIPFVPGAEIGLALLMAHGAAAAPIVWGATAVGLMLAFGAGRALAAPRVCLALDRLGFDRAAAALARLRETDPEARMRKLEDSIPRWARRWVLRRRYLVLALLVNLPGNSLIGGGGGILLAAGLSRLFQPVAVALTMLLATAPLPLAVMLIGPGILG
ncbi:MAG: hypothetical protein ACU0E9_00055 [Limimaricola soesokkakensis]|uniref:hypothetical protein n=1 Tax=Limimaricola soesokkakensis TaxID=1343159 RepID=UPI004059D9AF